MTETPVVVIEEPKGTPEQPNFRGRSVLIAIPTYDGKVQVETMGCVLQAADMIRGFGGQCGITYVKGYPHIAKARNALAKHFCASLATDLLFLDADIEFSPSALPFCMAQDKDIIGVACRVRDDKVRYKVHLRERDGVYEAEGSLLKADRMGTGFMLIKRQVMETLRKSVPTYRQDGQDYPLLFHMPVTEEGYVGEDYYFCDLAREAGFELFLSPQPVMTHYGAKAYSGSFADDILTKEEAA